MKYIYAILSLISFLAGFMLLLSPAQIPILSFILGAIFAVAAEVSEIGSYLRGKK